MLISMVVAAADNYAIGKENHLLWHLPNDLKFMKNLTWAFPVIMGRKTFESLGKALPGRKNIVVTHKEDFQPGQVAVVDSLEGAIIEAQQSDTKEIFILGGGEIYKQAMPIADRIYLTRVHAEPDADTYFPVIDVNDWELKKDEPHQADDKHAYSYNFQTWDKKR